MVYLYLTAAQHVFFSFDFLHHQINVSLFYIDRLVTLQIFLLRVLYTHWHTPDEYATLRVSLEKVAIAAEAAVTASTQPAAQTGGILYYIFWSSDPNILTLNHVRLHSLVLRIDQLYASIVLLRSR